MRGDGTEGELDILAQLRRDFMLYAPLALRIRTKDGAIGPLLPNRTQRFIHERLEAQRADRSMVRALVLKGRQQGVSTYVQARYYHLTSGELGKYAYILTHEDRATANIFSIVERFHRHCPDELRPHTGTANAKELNFDLLDSGYLVATAGTKHTGRSATTQLFHGSEMAFWGNAADHLAGIGQTVPDAPGTEIIFESTANGMGNEFHAMWQDAVARRGDYIALFAPWFWEGGYRRNPEPDFALEPEEQAYATAYKLDIAQMAWRRQKVVDDFRGDASFFDQEYPASPDVAFQRVLGRPLIPAVLVAQARKASLTSDTMGGPKILGVDPAEYGDDDSAIIKRQGRRAWDLQTWHGIDPMQLAGKVALVVDAWEKQDGNRVDAINVDATGIGSGTFHRLRELGYPAHRIMVGETARDNDTYHRVGDEIWGRILEWLRDAPSHIPDNDRLQGELTSRQYDHDSNRRIRLWPKERMRDKLGVKSPDCADALALTFAMNVSSGRRRSLIDHNRRTNPMLV